MIYKNLICSGANFSHSAIQPFMQHKAIDVTTAQRTIASSCRYCSSSSSVTLTPPLDTRAASWVEIFVRACARLIIIISIRHSVRSLPLAAINSGAMRQLSTLLNWLALAASSTPEVHRCATATQLWHCRQRMLARTVAVAGFFCAIGTKIVGDYCWQQCHKGQCQCRRCHFQQSHYDARRHTATTNAITRCCIETLSTLMNGHQSICNHYPQPSNARTSARCTCVACLLATLAAAPHSIAARCSCCLRRTCQH